MGNVGNGRIITSVNTSNTLTLLGPLEEMYLLIYSSCMWDWTCLSSKIISIFHRYVIGIEKSDTRVTVQHYEASRAMSNSDPE